MFFFFFSSRRRHTRYWRDWSSDVCSSDLAAILAGLDAELAGQVGGIAYARVAVVALGYRQAGGPAPPGGFGYIAPQRARPIGRASGRGRGENSGVAGTFKKKKQQSEQTVH